MPGTISSSGDINFNTDPVDELVKRGATLAISINASPFHLGKRALRVEMFRAMALRHKVPFIVVNQAGGNDQVVFDGSSFAMMRKARSSHRLVV